MKKQLQVFFLSGLTSTGAFAAEGYIGAEVGQITSDLNVGNGVLLTDYDAKPIAVKVLGGSELNKHLAVEGYFGFGLSDDELIPDLDIDVYNMAGLGVRGILPLGDVFSLNGKVGVASIAFEGNDEKFRELGIEYGVGMKVGMGSYAITLDYIILPDVDLGTDFDLELESEMISVGLRYYP